MKNSTSWKTLLVMVLGLAAFGCGESQDASEPAPGEEGLDVGAEDPELGKSLFAAGDDVGTGKADSLSGRKGLPVSVDSSSTAVWEVRNDWTDTDTPEARKAGMAWGENSGLTWDEKYSAWIRSMRKTDSESYFETYEMTTPYGKVLPAAAIECAETSLFLRATFASWYGLPFFVEAADRNGRIYLGHFGFRREGGKYSTTPNFKTAYRDYSDRADTWDADGWPSDSRLRGRKLGGSQDDYQPALFEGARAGAYFDELYLNKRTGYFMVYLLSYFGSVNLASNANMYHLKPQAVREGDSLVKRYGRTGIGHVYVVKQVDSLNGAYEVALISGSMPRRQGKWESPAASKSAFSAQAAGGHGENYDGDTYAALGGGLRRWRIAANVSGRWTNIVAPQDRDNWINSRDYDAIAERTDTWKEILREVPAAEKRAVILQKIEDDRNHLRNYPASCSARERREAAFKELYELEEGEGMSKDEVDAKYRNLEDYVFAELVYQESKTCCWNSTTDAMYEIIMQKAMEDVEDHTAQQCKAPLIFKARDGDYDAFKAYAQSIGRGGEWVAWSEDESCPQRGAQEDVEAELQGASWCEVGHIVLNGGVDPDVGNGGNGGHGGGLEFGRTYDEQVCFVDEYFEFNPSASAREMTIVVKFNSFEGDIDIKLLQDGDEVDSSTSYNNEEKVTIDPNGGTYKLQVYRTDDDDNCQDFTLRAEVR